MGQNTTRFGSYDDRAVFLRLPQTVVPAIAVALVLGACTGGPGLFEQEQLKSDRPNLQGSSTMQDVTISDDVSSGKIADNSSTQTLQASTSGALAGSSVMIPPGSLAIGTAVTIEEGLPLAHDGSAAELGLGETTTVQQASPAVMLAADSPPTSPLTLALPLIGGASLWRSFFATDSTDRLVVFFRVTIPGTDRVRTGVILRDKIRVSGSTIEFETMDLGTYQAGWLPAPITAPVTPVESTAPILTVRQVAAMEPVTWAIKQEFVTSPEGVLTRIARVSFTVGGIGAVDTCVASIHSAKDAPAVAIRSLGSTPSFDLPPTALTAHERFVRVRCRGTNGRDSNFSDWIAVAYTAAPVTTTLPRAPGAPSITVAGPAVTKLGSVTLNLSATEATEMYVTNAADCSSGGVWEAFATSRTWPVVNKNGLNEIRVKFRNAAGVETGCISTSVTGDDTAPGAFNVTAPSSASTVYSLMPSISWSVPTDATSVRYVIRMSTADSCGDTSDDLELSVNGNPAFTTSTSWTVPAGKLINNTEYRVCIVAVDAAGNQSLSPTSTFKTHVPSFTCDTGTITTTCTVTTTKTVTNNSYARVAGNLVISGSGAIVTDAAQAVSKIEVVGSLALSDSAQITGNFEISAGSMTTSGAARVSADGKGFAGASDATMNGVGTGGGLSAALDGAGGGAHGGSGGDGEVGGAIGGSAYGDPNAPVTWGSGGGFGGTGGFGGAGGGALKISVTGPLNLGAGTKLSANGLPGVLGGGGGAGGSIWLSVGSVAGTGTIETVGGNAALNGSSLYGGGGGGGRIYLGSSNKFVGMLNVEGGAANPTAKPGAPGTFHQNITNGLCDTGVVSSNCTLTTRTWVAHNQATFAVTGNLTIAGSDTLRPVSSQQTYKVSSGGILLVQSGQIWTVHGHFNSRARHFISDLSALTLNVEGTLKGNLPSLRARNVSVGASGWITADGLGFAGGGINQNGLGPGGGGAKGGGGHCGAGGSGSGITGGAVQSSELSNPLNFGSGGGGSVDSGGGAGGGLLRLVPRASLTIVVGGKISADGVSVLDSTEQGSGGGAGGTVIIDTGSLSVPAGSSITARGGHSGQNSSAQYRGTGGGGGCLMVRRASGTPAGLVAAPAGTGELPSNDGSVVQPILNASPGYRKIFVTSNTLPMNNLAALDSACLNQASLAGLPAVTYKAFVATTAADLVVLSSGSGQQIVNARGDIVAFSHTALFASDLLAPLGVQADGSLTAPSDFVATGASAAGTVDVGANCLNFTSASSSEIVQVGLAGSKTMGQWNSISSSDCSSNYRVYCISSP
jgi:hypothetical protein